MKSLPNLFFQEAESLLQQGQTVRIKVEGNSMLPFLRGIQDTIVLTPFAPEELKRGAVVLFRHKSANYMVHRITSRRGNLFQLCGDGNCVKQEQATLAEIAGLLRLVECPSGRVVSVNSLGWRIASELWIQLFPIRSYLLRIYRIIHRSNR